MVLWDGFLKKEGVKWFKLKSNSCKERKIK